jgi:FkbM family methyltransferase
MKALFRRLRRVRFLNGPATFGLRTVMGWVGVTWEPVIAHLPRIGVVAVGLPNGRRLRMITDADDGVSNQVFWRGWDGFEPEVSPLFFQLATGAQFTLDVGAHIGYYALLAGHARLGGRVFAFEPYERPLRALRRNVAANGVVNIEIVAKAAGRASGPQDFYYFEIANIPSSSSLSREFMLSGMSREFIADREKLRHQVVDVVALDDFCDERGLNVDLVKIDTEATEHDVLIGMRKALERCRPHVILEMLPAGRADVIDALVLPLGYRPYLLRASGGTPYDSVGAAVGNWYLRPPGRAFRGEASAASRAGR